MIGIAIGVFFAGLGIGYAIFQPNQSNFTMMDHRQMTGQFMNNPQLMRDMFSDPQFMQEMMKDQQFNQMMMGYMMQNPDQVNSWMMQNPQHIQQMTTAMNANHDFMQAMLKQMIDDPAIRMQMLGHMTENQEAMQQMRMIVNGTIQMSHMGTDMMNP